MLKSVVAIVCLLPMLSIAQSKESSVAGQWQITILGDHGVPFGMELKQDDRTVTGTLYLRGHGGDEVPLSGQLADNNLSLSTNSEDAKVPQLLLKGTLKEDGTMDGYVIGKTGTRKWTAERLGKKDAR